MAARIAQKLMEKPGRNSAIALCAAVSALVAVNATYMQPGKHPAPLFQTRAPGGQLAALMHREVRTVSAGADLRYPPLVADRALISEVQSMLAVKGFYHGLVDGVDGPETRAAIADYERGINVSPTGEPSVKLLARMRMDQLVREELVPLPARAPANNPNPETPAATSAITATQILSVQQAMNSFGYGPVTADGVFGDETSAAIQRFEMNQGITVTGKISDDLIVRLMTIGALN
ncbi:MAG: peptidoglycan-binding protein [Alphaproteobacteria bacterium]|nr:peptidoglycan-binding protein [Alphaproteobacteria bacterium]